MWFSARLCIGALLVAVLAALGVAELVLDVRTPRSALIENHAIGTNTSSRIADFDATAAAMKSQYGPGAVTTIQSPPLRWVVKVDGRVVHEEPLPTTFGGVMGLFVIGTRGHGSTFPFRLDPQETPPPHQYSSMMLRNRFKDVLPARYLDFNDAEVGEGPCIVLAPTDLGPAGRLLQIQTGTFCMIDWNGSARASAMVGAVLAHGDPWMRPFARRICRTLTSLALRKIAAVRPQPPEYAACVLVDRPTRGGATENSTVHVFEVGPAAALAVIEPPESRPAMTTALASPK